MLTRREFIRTAALFALAPRILAEPEREIWVNDVHSQLNRTRVREASDAAYPRGTCRDCAFGVAKRLTHFRFGLSAFDGWPAIRHRQHLHRYAFTPSRNFFRSGAWFDRSGSGDQMAKIDSHLSERSGE